MSERKWDARVPMSMFVHANWGADIDRVDCLHRTVHINGQHFEMMGRSGEYWVVDANNDNKYLAPLGDIGDAVYIWYTKEARQRKVLEKLSKEMGREIANWPMIAIFEEWKKAIDDVIVDGEDNANGK